MSAATTAAAGAAAATAANSDSDSLKERTLEECLERSGMTVEEAMSKGVEKFCTEPPAEGEGAVFVIILLLVVLILGAIFYW